jgi:hypothetical protein
MQAKLTDAAVVVAPAVIDFEASGFGRGSYPIEVGFVMPDGQSWCSLVRPEPDWQHWEPGAAALHHIDRESLLRHGRTAAEIVLVLNERLRGMTVYSDGWANDYSWMSRLYDAADRSPSFKLDNLRALLDENDVTRWDEIKRRVISRLGVQRHRASADARVLQQTVLALRQMA